ncbi:asb005 [Agrotis segetum nucleopolyhedrovirus B]|uniref:Asb005 n=2 Tax=Alphabaculovirus TaxID=558016 RepID=A0A0A7KR31_9ABAC|nr:asb005 [Agrotis segetum nucleopolyhedrovirus B]AIZ48563.1 asb005 [Agrotis segetum nucleopolyhedrovirus B]
MTAAEHWQSRNLTELQGKCSSFILVAPPHSTVPCFRYQFFWSAKMLIRSRTPIYSGKFRIVDYYTSIVYTVQYALHILHFKAHFCTAKKFTSCCICGHVGQYSRSRTPVSVIQTMSRTPVLVTRFEARTLGKSRKPQGNHVGQHVSSALI